MWFSNYSALTGKLQGSEPTLLFFTRCLYCDHNFNGHPQAETKDIDTISQVTTQQLASLNPLKASTCKFFA